MDKVQLMDQMQLMDTSRTREGLIVECGPEGIVAVTHDGEFVTLQYKQGAEVGQSIHFFAEDEMKAAQVLGSSWRKSFLSVAAIFLIALAAVFQGLWNPVGAAAVLVSIDINPSMEMALDKDTKVVGIHGLNSDGTALLTYLDERGMKLKGMPYSDAMEHILEVARVAGYDTAPGKVLVGIAPISDEGEAVVRNLKTDLEKRFSDKKLQVLTDSNHVKWDEGMHESLGTRLKKHMPADDDNSSETDVNTKVTPEVKAEDSDDQGDADDHQDSGVEPDIDSAEAPGSKTGVDSLESDSTDDDKMDVDTTNDDRTNDDRTDDDTSRDEDVTSSSDDAVTSNDD